MRDHHSPEVRGPLGASATSLLLLFGVVVSIVLVSMWLSDSSQPSDAEATAVVSTTHSESLDTLLPELGESSPEELGPDSAGNAAAAAIDASFDPAELIEEYPRSTVKGRVVLMEGGDIPGDMNVKASLMPPRPTVRLISLATMDQRATANFHAISNAALRARTRVEVGQDGRFEMPDFPSEGEVWIDVDHPDWYQPRPQIYSAPEEGGELVIELARGAVIQGRIVEADGQPVVGASVEGGSKIDPYAILDGTSLMLQLDNLVSDKDGRFEFTPVPPRSTIVLSIGPADGLQPTALTVQPLAPGEVTHVDIVVLRGGTIEGLVLDYEDQPVAHTQVIIQPTSFSMSDVGLIGMLPFDKDKSTDESGRFRFDSLGDGSYRLSLAKGGYRPILTDAIDVSAGQVIEGITLRADRGLSVSGRVSGPDGEAVLEARVVAFLPPSMFSMRANADRGYRANESVDEDGLFELWGYDEGELRVSARAVGYVSNSVDVAAGASDIVLQLQRKTAITGIAIDLSTGDPLTEYQLRLTPSDASVGMAALLDIEKRMRSRRAPLDVSDDEGRFAMDDVTPGTYDLQLLADGYAQTIKREIVVAEGGGANGVIIMVAEEASVTGQVVSGRTGQTLSDVTVTTGKTDAMNAWTQMLSGPVPKTQTDASGRFTLSGLGEDPVTITLQHQDHRSVVLAGLLLRPAEVHDSGVISLPPGGTIHGTVYGADEQPAVGISVMAADAMGAQMKRATTEFDGTYVIQGLAAGAYSVMRMDFSFSTDSDNPASMLEGLTFETVNLELDEVKQVDLGAPGESGCLLEGVVTSSAGPEDEALVIVVKERGPPNTKFTSTNEDGHYQLKGLSPGQYLVQVMPSGSIVGGGSQPSSPVFSTVVIGDEANQRHDIELPGAVLRAEVRARGVGGPLSGIRVLLERVDEGRPSSYFVERMGGRVGESYSDAKGEVRFEHLPAGTYALQAGGSNLMGLGEAGWAVARIEDIAVREGSAGFKVVIELDPGGAVEGIVQGPDDRPLANVPIWSRNDETGRWTSMLSEVKTDASGRYTINSLEPGNWTLAFGGDNWALQLVQGIHVQRERTAERDVELEKGVEVFAELGPHAGAQLSAIIHGPQGVVPTELTSMTALLSGGAYSSQRHRLGRLPHGSYDLSLYADGAPILKEIFHLGSGDSEIVVSLPEED